MKLLLLSKLLQCAVIINQNTEKGSCQKRSLLILKFQHPFQLGVDIGSSTVARGVVSLVLGYLSNLVIEMAFLIQVKQLYFQTAKQMNSIATGIALQN
jgi:hypothetical protein